MSSKRFIELYSGFRNRVQYPEPAQFEVPFSPTQNSGGQNASDPIVNGGVYYKFKLSSLDFQSKAPFGPGSTSANPVLSSKKFTLSGETPSYIIDYYVGWYIVDLGPDPNNIYYPDRYTQLIIGYNPSTLTLTLAEPLDGNITGHFYGLITRPLTSTQISIPAVDVNFNSIINYELAYNGYYVVFESPDPAIYNPYSNANNSNIVSRKITYYDSKTRTAYFSYDKKYDSIYVTSGIFTLRKELPSERLLITTNSYINNVQSDPVIGPLIGPVITLPGYASSVDNYYKGQFVYYYSNNAYTYPDILPRIEDIVYNIGGTPLPGVFYPIYGAYYIKAYNGTTKQLSVDYDINNTPLPTYIPDMGFNSESLRSVSQNPDVTQIGPNTYKAVLTGLGGISLTTALYLGSDSALFTPGKTYQINWRIKAQKVEDVPYPPPSIKIRSSNFTSGWSSQIGEFDLRPTSDEYITYTISVIPITPLITFNIQPPSNATTTSTYTIEWDLFVMSEIPIINICAFGGDNYKPLSYTGSMVSINEAVCYEVDLISLTLPNDSLLTGSRISFYPYVYVEFANATAPNGASRELIYSNNPNSQKALFIAATPNQVAPLLSTFVTLSGSGMSQTVKFKPNDNLRFSVYLPNGTLFQTLQTDFYSPYIASERVQIDAVFSIRRL